MNDIKQCREAPQCLSRSNGMGGELQSDYKNRLQDMPGIHMKASPQVLPDGKVTAILESI